MPNAYPISHSLPNIHSEARWFDKRVNGEANRIRWVSLICDKEPTLNVMRLHEADLGVVSGKAAV